MLQPDTPQPHKPVTTVILAGGLGTRIGGDKGLQILHGRTLISWVLEVIRRDGDEILINANNVHGAYQNFGFDVIADQLPDWPGPLAGLHAALLCAQHDCVVTVPCDTPFLPVDIITRLQAALSLHMTEAAVAVVAGRRQPAIALYRKSVLPKLNAYLGAGGRKVNNWLDGLQLSEVVFDNAADFDNINSQEDLVRANLLPARTLRNSGKQINRTEKV